MDEKELEKQRKRVIGELEKDRDDSPWTLEDYKRHFARTWDLYEEESGYLHFGEVVCRHVAVECGIEAKQRGNRYRIDTWGLDHDRMRRMYGVDSKYGGHATFCVEIGADWYYIDAGYNHILGRHEAKHRKVRAHDNPDWQGLPLTRKGEPDVRWMENLPRYGRILSHHMERVDGTKTEDQWRFEYFKHRMYHIRQLRTGEAEDKVGKGKGKRKVLA